MDPSAGSKAPKVETTANGTPIVQIANPSAAGVSRNQFTRFDVDPGGLILNNSTTLSSTQLAGWVAANPNLTKSASVILNEVTGGNPSQLLGYLEVAGQKAEVVIANPNGITCNGCGFINASRGTLTTGTPVFGGSGTLDAFRVASGTISVAGAGLDGRSVDRVDLISRAVAANAGIWAKELNVITGANQVDRASLAATPTDGAGAAPAVSVDVGALGGMYAGKILLVGTERGVGVSSAGTLASTGEFRLESNGQIVLRGSTTSGGAMTVRAASLDSQGTLYSAGTLDVGVTGAISTSGLLAAQGDVTVQAGSITLGGLTGAGISPDAQVTGQSTLALTAANGIAAPSQQLVSGGGITLEGATLSLAGAAVKAGGSASFTARAGGIDLSGAHVDAGDALNVAATGGDVQATNGSLAANGAITLSTTGLFDNTGGLVLGNEVVISADQIRSQGAQASIVAAGDMRLYAATSLVNADGSLIYAGGNLLIAGARATDPTADPTAAGSVANRSAQIEAGGSIAIYASELRNEKSVYQVAYSGIPIITQNTTGNILAASKPGSFWTSFVPGNYDWGDGWSQKSKITETLTYAPTVTADSAPAELRAGGDIKLRGGAVVNDQSVIAAGGSIQDQGTTYTQPTLPGNEVVIEDYYSVTATRIKPCHGEWGCTPGHYPDSATFTSTPEVKTDVFETVPGVAQRQENTGAAPTAPGVAATSPQITLPTNRLFTVNPDPTSRYLVETDPRFTKLGKFITSDYLLDQLPVNPEAPVKRLGDGFYEERLVMDELFRATGKPYLPGFGDALAQYQALMDEGLVYAKKFNLSPGIALSADQLTLLTLPMVWMVEVEVDGQKVLAPQVYVPSGKEVALNGGAVVAGGGAAWQLSGDFTAGGAVSAGQDLTVTAGSVRSSGGSFAAGGDTSLAGKSGVRLDSASVAAAGNISIASSDGDVTLGATTRSDARTGGPLVAVVGTTVAAGGGVGVQSGGDLRLTAATIQGNAGVDLSAGRDLVMDTAAQLTAASSSDKSHVTGSITTSQIGTTVQSAQGGVRVTAARDSQLQGATVVAAGDVFVGTGGDLSLTAARDTVQAGTQQGRKLTTSVDETVKGTTIQGGGAVTLAAAGTAGDGKGKISLEAATVQAGGDLRLAGKDLTIADAREAHDSFTVNSWHKHGFLSSKSTSVFDEVKQDLSIGSVLSGNTVELQSEGDLLIQGSQVVGQGDVAVRAQGDVTIAAGEDRTTEVHKRLEKRSGWLGGNGGIGFTVGTRRKKVTVDVDTLSHEREGDDGTATSTSSTVGSIAGGVVVDAGHTVDARGSDLIAKGDIAISGQDVLVDSVYDTTRTRQVVDITQNGFSVALSNGVVNAGLAVYQSAHRATEVKDPRLKALYALRSLRQAQEATEAIQAMQKNQGDARSVKITLGATHSESRTESTTVSSTALGSNITTDGNIVITARGDPAQDPGDVTVVGSSVKGGNVTLDAARDIVLRSAENKLDNSDDSLSWSVTVGVGVTVGQGKAAAGVSASGNIQKTDDDGHDRSHTETQLESASAITLRSGRDTALKGAVVKGDSITADVGRNLLLESEQDTSTYHSTDLSASAQGTYGYGASYNLTLGYSGMESSYRSVQQQTGLFAGKGGYSVHVTGNTDLKGAVIASEADASKNLLDTGSLTFSNIGNESKYSAVSVSVSMGSGGFSPSAGAPIQGDKSSTTFAAVSPGTIVIRNGSQDLSGLSRDTAHATNAIGNLFDKATVEERKELTQVFGEEGFKLVGDIAQHFTKPYTDAQGTEAAGVRYKELLAKGDDLTDAEQDELKRYQEARFTPANVDDVIAQARATQQQYQAQYDLWKDGSELKTALHAAVGAMQAGLGGGSILAGGVGAGTSERLSEITARLPDSIKPFASLIVGAAAAKLTGGGTLDAIAGGSAADYGFKFNRQLHQDEKDRIQEIARHWQDYPGYFLSEEDALNRLLAAACYMVHCAADRPPGADTAEFGIVAESADLEGRGQRLMYVRQLLEQNSTAASPGQPRLFTYTTEGPDSDAARDAQDRAFALRQPSWQADRERPLRILNDVASAQPCLTGALSPNDPQCWATYKGISSVPVVGPMFKGAVQPWIGVLTGDDPWTVAPDCGDKGCIGLPQVRSNDGSLTWVPMSQLDPTRSGYARQLLVNSTIGVAMGAVGMADPALADLNTFIPLKPPVLLDDVTPPVGTPVAGKVISTHSMIDPGPLSPDLAGTFPGGRYTVIELQDDAVLYRAGVAGKPLGQFFDTEPPQSVLQTRIDKAVLPVWPGGGTSPLDTSYAVLVPKGTLVYVGDVGSQGGFYVGGTRQVVVVKPWTIKGVTVVGSTPLK